MKDFWSSVMPRGRGKDKRKTIVDRKERITDEPNRSSCLCWVL
jgi:hypothetical protein